MPGEIGFVTAWACAIGFGFQIYFDFSAYSDMALGLARIFGIELPWNFDRPYRAASPTEFWRRWHVTLSTWLRDYLYIPLGGNRKGERRRDANLFVTMGLGGLWHGASLNFVAWGLYQGVLLVGTHHGRRRGWSLPRPARRRRDVRARHDRLGALPHALGHRHRPASTPGCSGCTGIGEVPGHLLAYIAVAAAVTSAVCRRNGAGRSSAGTPCCVAAAAVAVRRRGLVGLHRATPSSTSASDAQARPLLSLAVALLAVAMAFDWWVDPFGDMWKPGAVADARASGNCLVSQELIGARYYSFKLDVFERGRPARSWSARAAC